MKFLPGVALPIPWWWLAAVFLAVGVFVYLPGYLLTLIVHRKRMDPIVLLADTPVFGFVFFSVFALAAYLLGWRWVVLVGVWGIGVGVLALVCWRSSARQRAGSVEWPRRWLFGLTASVAICLGLLSFGTQWVESGDSAIHLQALTRMAHRPVVSLPTYSLLTDVPVWDHAFDSYYPLLILLARASDLELYELWRLLSAVWILSLPFGVVSLARELGGSVSLALWAGAMTLLVPLFAEPVLWGTVIGTLVYPNRLYLWLHVPVALRFAIVALRTGERRAAVIAAIIISSSMLVHPMGVLIFGLTLATYGLLMVPLAAHGAVQRIKRTAIQLAYVGALALPLAALKWPYGREYLRLCSQE